MSTTPENVLKIIANVKKHTAVGDFVSYLYYRTVVLDGLVKYEEMGGFPDSGGMHYLRLYLSLEDIGALISLLLEQYGSHPIWGAGAQEFAELVLSKAGLHRP